MLGTDSTASVAVRDSAVDGEVAAPLTTAVDCTSAGVGLTNPGRLVAAPPAESLAVSESPCGGSGVAGSCATGGDTDSAEGAGAAPSSLDGAAAARSSVEAVAGGSADESAATADVTLVSVGVASADASVSLLDGVEVCAPLEPCPTPDRESAVAACRGNGAEFVWESAELWASSGVEPDDESDVEADDPFAEVDSVDDVRADSDDELDVDDELGELVSVGSADATAGVFVTTAPTPSANARTPARTRYCASIGMALNGYPTHRSPELA